MIRYCCATSRVPQGWSRIIKHLVISKKSTTHSTLTPWYQYKVFKCTNISSDKLQFPEHFFQLPNTYLAKKWTS